MDDALNAWIDQAWTDHAQHPEAVAERLAVRAALPIDDDQLEPFVGLLTHVFGAHLQRWGDGIALLRGLEPRAPGAACLPRAIAALSLAAGDPHALEGLPAEQALAARASASAALLDANLLPRAIGLFREALAQAEALVLDDRSPPVRALAVAGNNLAASLEERTERAPDETRAMLQAAEAGLRFWRRCGTWLQHERACYRLACSQLAAGDAAAGLAAARNCLEVCEAHAAAALERFFGHAVAARCASRLGDAPAFESEHEKALAALALGPADEQPWCQADLAALRAAAGSVHPGRCVCGAVRYRLTSRPLFVHACHCRWCQRETGTAFATNAMIETDRLQLLGEAPQMVNTPTASGKGQDVARCPHCHVALWSHYAGAGRAMAFVRVGTLLDPDRLPPDIHIFTSTRRPDVVLPEGVPAVPGYYDRKAHWPAESLQRREALLAQVEAHPRELKQATRPALYERAPQPKRWVLVEGGSHHNTHGVGQPLYRQTLRDPMRP